MLTAKAASFETISALGASSRRRDDIFCSVLVLGSLAVACGFNQ